MTSLARTKHRPHAGAGTPWRKRTPKAGGRTYVYGSYVDELLATQTSASNNDISGYTLCTNEWESFALPSTCDVAYGAKGSFAFRSAQGGTITFTNATFGDPAQGAPKKGYYRLSGGQRFYAHANHLYSFVALTDAVIPPPLPIHLLAQQSMALALQTGGLKHDDWKRWLAHVPDMLSLPSESVSELFGHMITAKISRDDNGLLWFDEAGEKTFGRKHFLELVSVFTSQPLLEALHGRSSIAYLDQLTFSIDNGLAIQKGRPTILTLGGKHWVVTDVDWRRREVHVKQSDDGGKTRWSGAGQDIGKPFSQAEQSILGGDHVSPRWSKRAATQLESCRSARNWLPSDRPLVRLRGDLAEWWTFYGTAMNRLIARQLDPTDEQVSFDYRRIVLQGQMTAENVAATWKGVIAAIREGARYTPLESQLDLVKFAEAVPRSLLAAQTSLRLHPRDQTIADAICIVKSELE